MTNRLQDDLELDHPLDGASRLLKWTASSQLPEQVAVHVNLGGSIGMLLDARAGHPITVAEDEMSARGARGSAPVPKVFVVGCARSGTTWVSSILARHPSVVSGNESHLFPVLYPSLSADCDPETRRRRVLTAFDERAREQRAYGNMGPHRWIDRGELERLLDEADAGVPPGAPMARYVLGETLDRYFERERGETGRVLVEKTPRHLMHARRILAWWPEARIAEVVRDGRDVCVSLAHKSEVVHWAPSERRAQIDTWANAIRHGQRARSSPEAEGRWHLVRYEDLSADPAGEIRRLYQFAGLGADGDLISEVVDETAFSKARRARDSHHVRRGVVGGWRQEFSAADAQLVDEVAGELLEAHGYERAAAVG